MQAVILAGGVGSRLRPLTKTTPKPLCPIANESAMARVLKLLSQNGFDDAVVTLCYRPRDIQDAFGKEAFGVKLHYLIEDKPRGTAGSVKSALPLLLEEDLLIISADVVCETDLCALMRYHKEKDALATLALTRRNEVSEYGVVETASDGRILRFLEKPSRAQACCDTVNAGIYCIKRELLKQIPDDRPYDFGHDLFPSLLGKGIYGYLDEHFWCDVGDIQSYYDCNFRIGQKENKVDANGNIVGKGVAIAFDATVRDSILMEDVSVGQGAIIEGAILCEKVRVQPHTKIGQGAVIGANTVIASGAQVGEGVMVDADTKVEEHQVKRAHYSYGDSRTRFFCDGGLHGKKEELTPEFFLQLGRACCQIANGKPIAVLHADSPYCALACSSFRCGVIASGGDLSYYGIGFCALASYCARTHEMTTYCIYEDADATVRVAVYDRSGLYPDRAFERALCQAFSEEIPDAIGEYGTCIAQESAALDYQKELCNLLLDLQGMPLYFNYTAPANLLRAACVKMGARSTASADATRIILDPTGRSVAYFESGAQPFSCDFWHIIGILLCHDRLEKELVLPYSAPMALCELAKQKGCQVRFYASCPSQNEGDLREKAGQQAYLRDAVMACAMLLRLCRETNRSAAELSRALPDFYTFVQEVKAPQESRVRILCALGKSDTDGVCISYGDHRRARVMPIGAAAYRIICEAESMEAADEIFVRTREKIRALEQEKGE